MKKWTLLTVLTLWTAAAVAGPVRTAGVNKPALVADAAIRKAEKAGTVSTQAQIDALLTAGKTKEALAAFFGREAKVKEAKDAAVKQAAKAEKADKADKKVVK